MIQVHGGSDDNVSYPGTLGLSAGLWDQDTYVLVYQVSQQRFAVLYVLAMHANVSM